MGLVIRTPLLLLPLYSFLRAVDRHIEHPESQLQPGVEGDIWLEAD